MRCRQQMSSVEVSLRRRGLVSLEGPDCPATDLRLAGERLHGCVCVQHQHNINYCCADEGSPARSDGQGYEKEVACETIQTASMLLWWRTVRNRHARMESAPPQRRSKTGRPHQKHITIAADVVREL